MIRTSSQFQQVVQGPHHHTARIEVVRDDVVVRTLDAHDGSVDADRNNAIMRRFACKVSDPTGELTPEGIRDLLAPFGTILRFYRGVKIPVIVQVVVVKDTSADWTGGTRSNTVADNGDLVLGFS